ncbi:MAG: DUF3592 domain-containing protein [Gemmatales bacterium]
MGDSQLTSRPARTALGWSLLVLGTVLCALFGPALLVDELYASWKMSEVVDGVVMTNDFREKVATNETSLRFVSIEYTVQGIRYFGVKYGASWFWPQRERESFLASLITEIHYQPGTIVPVYYANDHPERSCLHRGVSSIALGLMLMSLAIASALAVQQWSRLLWLHEDGYTGLFMLFALLLLLFGPTVVNMTWAIVILVFMVGCSTPVWKWLKSHSPRAVQSDVLDSSSDMQG